MKKELSIDDFDKWYLEQVWADDTQKVRDLGGQLTRFMKAKGSIGGACTTHFFKHGKSDASQGFFYYGSPLNERLVSYLVAHEKVRYTGRKIHHGIKYKSWTLQADENAAAQWMQIRAEIADILSDSQRRKETIKTAASLYLNLRTDFYLRWLFKNSYFEVLAGGMEDFSVTEGKEGTALVENVCPEFISAITELQAEGRLKLHPNGYVLPGKKFKFSMRGKEGNDPLLVFVSMNERTRTLRPNLH